MNTTPDKPELACAILSLGNEPGLVTAVQSLLAQDPPAELVVVNSGGGDPEASLRAAGISVPVINRTERLYAGAVRNLGVEATHAPHVSFLAADCMAEPGWVAARLREHRAGAKIVSSVVTNAFPNNAVAQAFHLIEFSQRMEQTPDSFWIHYGCSYDRDLFDRFGPFREDLRAGEDTEFHLRLNGEVPFSVARDVRTAHRNPTQLFPFLRDQLRRGVRRVRSIGTVRGVSRWRVLKNTLQRIPARTRILCQRMPAAEQKQARRSYPLIAAGLAARAAGILFAPRRSQNTPQNRRIYALTPFRNEMRYLPGYFRNLEPHVDGFILLDDGSTDDSYEFARRQPKVIEIIRKPIRTAGERWNDGGNRILLDSTAGRYDPDWVLVIDADERVERHFRIRAINEIARAERERHQAYAVVVRELWDGPKTYRVDGIWKRRHRTRLYRWRPDPVFETHEYHLQCAPLNSKTTKWFPHADLIIYHLNMITPMDRRARYEKFRRVDPDNKWQKEGYEYLVDANGLQLETFPRGREYEPLADAPDLTGDKHP